MDQYVNKAPKCVNKYKKEYIKVDVPKAVNTNRWENLGGEMQNLGH